VSVHLSLCLFIHHKSEFIKTAKHITKILPYRPGTVVCCHQRSW